MIYYNKSMDTTDDDKDRPCPENPLPFSDYATVSQ